MVKIRFIACLIMKRSDLRRVYCVNIVLLFRKYADALLLNPFDAKEMLYISASHAKNRRNALNVSHDAKDLAETLATGSAVGYKFIMPCNQHSLNDDAIAMMQRKTICAHLKGGF